MYYRWVSLIVLGGALGAGCKAFEQPRRHYASYASAIESGEGARAWLPPWIPSTATDLIIQNDIEGARGRWERVPTQHQRQ